MRETGISQAAPADLATDQVAPAWRLWLTQVYVRESLERLRNLLDDRRQLRGQSGNGWRRKGLRRRLAHAAGCLFLALGLLRGVAPSWPISAATVPLTGHTIDGAFDGASSVSFADLDGDGDLDALGAAVIADDITWWESDGSPADGGWVTHTIITNFDGARSVTSADLDGDGDLDVLGAAVNADDITWWENDGSPANGGWITHTIDAAFDGAFNVSFGDLDGDGDLDVQGAAFNADDITWWENDGTPADGGWVTHTIDALFDGARSVAVADLDGDGDIDVLGASSVADDISWWENDGSPADGGWTTHTISGTFNGGRSVAAADLDGDGDIDVLGAAYGIDDITWWENDGTPADGGWVTHTIDGAFTDAISVAAADLDGDGDLDALGTAFTIDTISWWENDGTPANGGWTTHTIDAAFDEASSVAAADLDGDGDIDVLGAASGLADDISWWENRTIHRNALLGGTIPFTHTIDGAFDGATGVSFADLDGDGDLDALGAAVIGDDITWWENDGSPADGGWITHTISGSFNAARSVTAADLDGDGDLDVVGAAVLDDDISWWENDGTPANGGWVTHTIDGSFDGAFNVNLGDLDGDGDIDVVGAAFDSNTVTWWENDGSPANGGWITHTIDAAFAGARSVTAADLDRDGDLDVVGASSVADDITWWENDGSPANGGWVTHTIDGAFNGGRSVAAADLDGDGDLDALGAAYGIDDITWWANDGTPTNGGWVTHTIDGGFTDAIAVAAADLDGDGDLDVLGAAYTVGAITWWENDGSPADGGWITHTIDAAFAGATSAVAADLDGDGDLDALAGANAGDAVTWWQNKGGQFTLPTMGTAPASMSPGGSDDFVKIDFTHNGRTGDNDEELVTLHLRFEDTTGVPDPLTTAEANAIIEDLKVYVDDGSGVFESGSDTLVATVGALALDGSGDQIVTFADADPNVLLPFATGTRSYFVVLDLTATYPGDPARNGVTKIRVTHITEASSTAEDQPNDLPLAMAFTANTQSSAGGTELLLPAPTPTPTAIAPTSVELRYFHAAGASDRVTLRWETATETDVLGFNVYRSTEAGQPGSPVNAALIPATGGAATGSRYELRDVPRAIGTYFYRLEVVDQGGPPEIHGPVTVRVDAIRAFLPWAKGGR